MGWFESGKAAGVILGDEPLDLIYDFLKQLADVYVEGCKRKPTLEEVRTLFEMVLKSAGDEYIMDLVEREVTAIVVNTKKKRKSQAYKQGDVLAIPIEGKRFAFGRLMLVNKLDGLLLEVFREISERKDPRPTVLTSGRMFHPVRFVPSLYVGGNVIKSWRWTVVTSDNDYAMTAEDMALEFKAHDSHGGWCAVDMQNNTVRALTDQEAKGMEWSGFACAEDVEQRIAEELKREEHLPKT